MNDGPYLSQGYVMARWRWYRVKNDICPECGGSLDTGWECNKCGRDWIETAQGEEPKPENYPDEPIPETAEEWVDDEAWQGFVDC
jgi:hypothetical protein